MISVAEEKLGAAEKSIVSQSGLPQACVAAKSESKLIISVIYTSMDATLAALKEAGALAYTLGADITLLVPQVVPYPLSLSNPPVMPDWNEKRFRVIAAQSHIETTVHFYLCRDRVETLIEVLKPHALVVIGGHKRSYWPTSEERLAKILRRAHHEVIFTENGAGSNA